MSSRKYPRGTNEPLHASRRNAPRFNGASHRTSTASAFNQCIEYYHDVRPGYPPQVIAMLRDYHRILDVGCGTGKLSAALAQNGHVVWGVDPSPAMTRDITARYAIPVWQATAESTALRDDSVDAVACAQTWHWLDAQAAAAEWDRIVRKGGRALLVWNTLDTKDPWVLRLARIMHAGDILRPGFTPDIPKPWRLASELRLRWNHHLCTADLFHLASTRSYWIRSSPHTREHLQENLTWFLYEYTNLTPSSAVRLPYRCDAFLLTRD